jgi:hypothetical protein
MTPNLTNWINFNVALKRRLGVLPNLYQAVFFHVLWVTYGITSGDFYRTPGNAVARRLEVPL